MLALKARGRAGVFVEHRDLFRRPLDAAELNRFEAVVLDPPRAGAKEQAPQLAASSVPRLAYVSCNPDTFARDARMLADGGYRLDWVKPVGQFRWSTHVELAAAFARDLARAPHRRVERRPAGRSPRATCSAVSGVGELATMCTTVRTWVAPNRLRAIS